LHSSFDQAVQAGLAAFRGGDFSGAIAAFERALALSPQHPAALDLLGTSWLAVGDPARALPLLEQAVQRAKNNPDAIVHLAQAYQALARHEDAYQQFRKASRLAPQNPHFGEGAAIALALLGRFAEA
jgi:Tfp pilus assembly protein PilF